MANISDTSPALAPPTRVSLTYYVPAIYLGAIWLTSNFNVPLAGFNNVPLYLVFMPLMFFYLPASSIKTAIGLLAVLMSYECLKMLQPGFSFTMRGVIGIGAFACIIATVHGSLEKMKEYSEAELHTWMRLILLLIFISIFGEFLWGSIGLPAKTDYHNYILGIDVYSGFFPEPSYVAIGLSPFIFLAVYDLRMFVQQLGISSLFCLIAIALYNLSATIAAIALLAFVMLAISRLLRGTIRNTILTGMGIVVLVVLSLRVPAIQDRVLGVFSADPATIALGNLNASSLAFIKGLETAYYAIGHFPLGVSFENMQVLAPHALISSLSDWLYDLNSNDGTSLLFKGICELGVLFEGFVLAGLVYFFRRLTWYPPLTFFGLMTLAFQFAVFAHFIRAPTYFSYVVPLGLASIIFAVISPMEWKRPNGEYGE